MITIKTIDDCNAVIKELCRKYNVPVTEFGAKFKQNYNIVLQFFSEIKNATEQKFVVCKEVLEKMDETYEYDFQRYAEDASNKATIAFHQLKNGKKLEYKDAFGKPIFLELSESKKAFGLSTYKIFDATGKKVSERIAKEDEIINHLFSLEQNIGVVDETVESTNNTTIKQPTLSIDKSELVPLPKLKKTDFMSSFKNIVTDDELRPVMQGVFFDADNGNVVASDSRVLAMIKNVKMPSEEIPEFWLNKIVDVNPIKYFVGEELVLSTQGIDAVEKRREEIRIIPGKYPKYLSIIPKSFRYEFTINIDELFQLALTAISKITKKFKNKTSKNTYTNHLIRINCDTFTVKCNPFILKNALEFLRNKNEKTVKIKLINSDRCIVFETEKVLCLVMPTSGDGEEVFYDYNIQLSIDDLKKELQFLNHEISELDINNENSENYNVVNYRKKKLENDEIGMEVSLSIIGKELAKFSEEKQLLLEKHPELLEFDVENIDSTNNTSLEQPTEKTITETTESSKLLLSPNNKNLIDVCKTFSNMLLKPEMQHYAYFCDYGVVVANVSNILFLSGTPKKLGDYNLYQDTIDTINYSIFSNNSVLDRNIQKITTNDFPKWLDIDTEKLKQHIAKSKDDTYFKIDDSFGIMSTQQLEKFISVFAKLNIHNLRIFFNGKDNVNPFHIGFVFASQNSTIVDVQNLKCDLIICAGILPKDDVIKGNIPQQGSEYFDLTKNEILVFGATNTINVTENNVENTLTSNVGFKKPKNVNFSDYTFDILFKAIRQIIFVNENIDKEKLAKFLVYVDKTNTTLFFKNSFVEIINNYDSNAYNKINKNYTDSDITNSYKSIIAEILSKYGYYDIETKKEYIEKINEKLNDLDITNENSKNPKVISYRKFAEKGLTSPYDYLPSINKEKEELLLLKNNFLEKFPYIEQYDDLKNGTNTQINDEVGSQFYVPSLNEVLTNKQFRNKEIFNIAQAALSIRDRLNIDAEKAYQWLNKFHFELQFLYIIFENPSVFYKCINDGTFTDEAKELIINREAARKASYVKPVDDVKINVDSSEQPTPTSSIKTSNENYEIAKARYSQGNYKIIVKDNVGNTWKNRTANLCEAGAVNGKYSNREKAYIVSENGAKNFVYLFENGYDYSPISDTLELPEKKQEGILNELNKQLSRIDFSTSLSKYSAVFISNKLTIKNAEQTIIEISFKTPKKIVFDDLINNTTKTSSPNNLFTFIVNYIENNY